MYKVQRYNFKPVAKIDGVCWKDPDGAIMYNSEAEFLRVVRGHVNPEDMHHEGNELIFMTTEQAQKVIPIMKVNGWEHVKTDLECMCFKLDELPIGQQILYDGQTYQVVGFGRYAQYKTVLAQNASSQIDLKIEDVWGKPYLYKVDELIIDSKLPA